jgi:hypothetical protein
MKTIGTTLLVCFYVASISAAQPITIPRIPADKEAILGDWLVLGPWTPSSGESALDVDFLASFGREEAMWTLAEIESLALDEQISNQRRRRVSGQECVDFGAIFRYSPAVDGGEAAGYAICVLRAQEAKEAYLLFGSDAKTAIWLNGERVYESRAKRSLRGYNDAVSLPLRGGDNLLVIKAANADRAWIFSAKLAPDGASASQAGLALSDGFFKRALVEAGEPLEMHVRGVPETAVFEAKLERYDGTTVRAVCIGPKLPVSTDGLADGLYRLVRSEGGAVVAGCILYR